jgi:hypothetical protein
MTRDDALATDALTIMAGQAGIAAPRAQLLAFAKQIAAVEREANARICMRIALELKDAEAAVADRCVKEIRARDK